MPTAAMPSSPPARAARPQSPGGESQYTLDLAALDMEPRSGASTPLPQRKVERVFSEDIDGPTDFTLNMTQWMKGGKQDQRVLDRLREEMPTIEDVPGQIESAEPQNINGAHHDSSDWDPYEQSATPEPPPHKQFLQPTVEEYYSELTPARFASAQSQVRRGVSGIHSSPTRVATDHSTAEYNELRLRFQELETKCKQVEARNSQLERSLADQRHNHEQDLAARDSKLAEVIRRESELVDARDDQDVGRRAKLEQQLEEERKQHNQRLSDMQKAIDEARRHQQEAEKMAESQAEAFDAHKDLHEAEICRIREDSKQEVEDLKEQLRSAQEDTIAEPADPARIERLESDYRRALELAQGLQRKLKELQQQMRLEQDRHRQEIDDLRKSNQASEAQAKVDLQSVQDEMEAKQSLVNDATLDRDALQDRLNALTAELAALKRDTKSVDDLKRQMAESETVNAIFDSKMSDRMRRREVYWQKRLDQLENERKLMAKALMHQWGREELGIQLPQSYQYKYAKAGV